jgi:hypothetical protein
MVEVMKTLSTTHNLVCLFKNSVNDFDFIIISIYNERIFKKRKKVFLSFM